MKSIYRFLRDRFERSIMKQVKYMRDNNIIEQSRRFKVYSSIEFWLRKKVQAK